MPSNPADMRVVPVLFPCDLGHHYRGEYRTGGERGALRRPPRYVREVKGCGLARPARCPRRCSARARVTLRRPSSSTRRSRARFRALAEVVADGQFGCGLSPWFWAVTTRRCVATFSGIRSVTTAGIGLAVLVPTRGSTSRLPAPPVYDDEARLKKGSRTVTRDGGASQMVARGRPDGWPTSRRRSGRTMKDERRAGQADVGGRCSGPVLGADETARKEGRHRRLDDGTPRVRWRIGIPVPAHPAPVGRTDRPVDRRRGPRSGPDARRFESR